MGTTGWTRRPREIATAACEEGEMRILELLDAHRIPLAARLKRIDLLEDARKAEAALSRAVGAVP